MATINNSLDTILTAYTPVVTGSTGSGTVGYTTQSGGYTRVGNLITVFFNVAGTITGVPTGDFQISLPFTSNATANLNSWGAIRLNVNSVNLSPVVSLILPNSAVCVGFNQSSGTNSPIVAGAYSVQGTVFYSV